MKQVPIIIICGAAGSGKDTVAQLIAEQVPNTTLIAQADPMKRFAARAFGFTEHQLWGPSAARNAPDPRYAYGSAWASAWDEVFNTPVIQNWGYELGQNTLRMRNTLGVWFETLAAAHGFAQDANGFAGPCLPYDQEPKILSPRTVLQTLGTEWGRKTLGPLVWNEIAIETAADLLDGDCAYERTKGLGDKEGAQTALAIITDGRYPNEVLGTKRRGGISVLVEDPLGVKPLTAGVASHASETSLNEIPRHWHDAIIVNDKDRGLDGLRRNVKSFVDYILGTPKFFSF